MKVPNNLKFLLEKTLRNIPFINSKLEKYNHYKKIINNIGYLPGHYYSTIPNINELNKKFELTFADNQLEEVDLNTENQIDLLHKLYTYYNEYPYFGKADSNINLRYKKEGAFYRYSDSVFLYSLIRHFNSSQIIEIGSGHSSAIMLDINDLFFNSKIKLTFIEPYPEERLTKILRESDKIISSTLQDKVQNVDINIFSKLEANDILFIDSSHVSKVGSDLNHLLFNVLPTLKPGVLIHFHDIFYPFEMPNKWILENKLFWNENYLLHAFLMNNNKYKIIAFNTYLQKIKNEWFKAKMPECLLGEEETGSIWLKKQ